MSKYSLEKNRDLERIIPNRGTEPNWPELVWFIFTIQLNLVRV